MSRTRLGWFWCFSWHDRFKSYLVVLKAVQQNVQVKSSNIVTHDHICIQTVQPANEVAQQGTLTGLDRHHVASISFAQLALVAVLDGLLKACNQRRSWMRICYSEFNLNSRQ